MQGEGEYTISDFIQSLSRPTQLSYLIPKDEDHLWTFWSEEDDGYLKYSLRWGIRDFQYYDFENILVQFWAPMTVGGRCVLKTSNQPFGLKRIERGLWEYRKHCMSLQCGTDFQDDEDFGVIGRVFRNKQMESTPNVTYYSTRDYPHLEIAYNRGIRTSLALPLLQPNNGECVSVLELVYHAEDISFATHLLNIAKNISKFWPLEAHLPIELQMRGHKKPEVPEEIIKALEAVCTTHRLPLAQIWIPDRPSRASYFWTTDKSFVTDVNSFYYSYIRFEYVCTNHHLRKDQGVVGKAHLFHKPCYCRDVSQLPIAEYPLSHYARKYGLTGCFAISLLDYVLEFFLPPLNTTSGDPQTDLESIFTMTKNHLQGFEICLGGGGRGPGEESYVEVVNISIHDDGQDSFKIFQTFGIQPLSVSSLQNETREEQVQNNVTDEAVVVDDDDEGRSAEHNEVSLTCSGKRVEMLVEERENQVGEEFVGVSKTDTNAEITTVFLPPTTETLQNDREVAQLSDDESVMEAGRKNELNVVVSEQNGVAVTYSDSSREETSEKERETNKLSRKDPGRHVGKKLDDVPDKRGEQSSVAIPSSRQKKSSRAEKTESVYTVKGIPITRKDLLDLRRMSRKEAANKLGIGKSSLQTACRHFGFESWPPPEDAVNNASSTCNVKNVNEEEEVVTRKRKKANPSNLKHINKRVRDGTKQIPKFDNSEPLCSHPPPTQTTGVVAHTMPNVTPKQDEGNVTVKATYGDEMIRFPLTFSSRKADLMDKVTLRLPLKDRAFYIKYQDDDGDWILVTCDEDLEECIRISKGKSTIKMLVQPITNEAP